MNSFLHPEVTTKDLAGIFYPNAHPLFTSVDGLVDGLGPWDDHAFAPQTQVFQWQETIGY